MSDVPDEQETISNDDDDEMIVEEEDADEGRETGSSEDDEQFIYPESESSGRVVLSYIEGADDPTEFGGHSGLDQVDTNLFRVEPEFMGRAYSQSHNRQPASRPVIDTEQSTIRVTGQNPEDDLITEGSRDSSKLYIWGTRVCVIAIQQAFELFVLKFDPLNPLTSENFEFQDRIEFRQPDQEKSFYLNRIDEISVTERTALDVNLSDIKAFNSALYRKIVCYPADIIPYLDLVVNQFFNERHQKKLRAPIEVRLFNAERTRTLRALNPHDIDQLVTIGGMITRTSTIIPEMRQGFFRCTSCDFTVEVELDRGRINEPTVCTNCHQTFTFQIIHNRCLFVDKQILKLQESPDDMAAGTTPYTVTLFVYGDLAESVQPGDRVTVTGIYRIKAVRINPRARNISSIYRTNIDVLHFSKHNPDRLHIDERLQFTQDKMDELMNIARRPDVIDLLLKAIAPPIFGHDDIKLGILLLLFGGTRKPDSDKSKNKLRSELNILLCGDPGTSKSQFLQYVNKMVPRAQFTSGKGSSAVGLTASVVRDPESKNFVLQTGALVLADNGVCCIDEFDKMNDNARSVLHEVMEQQTLSIAKAGIICQLNARTSILAAANPVDSKWNRNKTIVDNIQLPHTLLSRFDLIYLLVDPQSEEHDRQLADHLVSLFFEEEENQPYAEVDSFILKDYIAYAQRFVHPEISDEASEAICKVYAEMRRAGMVMGQISAYPRQIESIIRLSEAFAKIRLHNFVLVEDVNNAYELYRSALKQSAIDPSTGKVDVNILAAGISVSRRKLIENLAQRILHDALPADNNMHPIKNLILQLRQTNMSFTKELFDEAISDLVKKEFVVRMGDKIRRVAQTSQ